MQYFRAVAIGGGIVGTSVLYHLAKPGWTDVALIERAELTAGSTWHAAAGFHALNADPSIAALQSYTIKLYREIEAETGMDLGLHMTGGVNFASAPDRWDWLKSAWAIFQSIGIDSARLMTPEEIGEVNPITDLTGLLGGLYDQNKGHLDPHAATHGFATAARKRGAKVILRNRVISMARRAEGGWLLTTEHGMIATDHVVNAGGLWAKQVGLMAGVDLPVTPMQHHYLVTDDVPEIAALDHELPITADLEGFCYLRQERKGALLGIYETNPRHWNMDGAPWDHGMELIPEEIDRIAPELTRALSRFPALERVGVKRWVNGAFTSTPDGNPLLGPVPGVPGYWVACGVMAGFSQGGGVGKSLAEWMIHGEPEAAVFGMDVARYGRFAANREYLKQTTAQFYARRFVMTYPNERLPAGRPMKRTPAYDAMTAAGGQWGVSWGLEVPVYFAPKGFTETPTLRRSNAFDFVGELGFELNCSAAEHVTLRETLLTAGQAHGLREIGYSVLNSSRLEKSFGIWSAEFRQDYTPQMTGMDRWTDFAKGDFIERAAALRDREAGPSAQTRVTLEIDAVDAGASGFEPVWDGARRVGFVSSGGYGPTVGKSLALALVDRDRAAIETHLDVHVVGVRRAARMIAASPHDLNGGLMRD